MKIPRWILVISLFALLATGIFTGIRIYQKQARKSAFYQKIESLMQPASKLAAMTTQGVNFNDFNSQLASVHAEYDLLKTQWEKEEWPLGYGSFGSAVGDWDLALLFWKRDLKLPAYMHHLSAEPNLLAFYKSMDNEGRALVMKDDIEGLNLQIATSAFLGDGSNYFDESKKVVQRAP